MKYLLGLFALLTPFLNFAKEQTISEKIDATFRPVADFVGHYIFDFKWFGVYPLMGANYSVEKENHLPMETISDFGLVVGAGLHRNFNKISVFIEYSRVELGIEDQFLTTGLLYNFK